MWIIRGFLVLPLALLLACLGLIPKVQAVVPAPDGGYPGLNTAEGTNALFNLTTGLYNTALGGLALYSNTGGSANTATGLSALYHNTTGASNTANGRSALFSNTTGGYNTATGYAALLYNTTGVYNTANGYYALALNTTGNGNTANGYQALNSNTTSWQNTATGFKALFQNTGGGNTANGYSALSHNTTGDSNTATGFAALMSNTTGIHNTADGAGALGFNTIGSGNVALGVSAGQSISTGSGNVAIGYNVTGANVSNTTWIRNINTTNLSFIAGTNNYVTVRMTDGALGWTAVVSSRRYKEDIQPMDKASEALLALEPVTFRLKGELDPSHRPQWGLIAEEVEKVNPDLVDRNNKGEVESVRYDAVNAMLLNEFLKEHRKVEKLTKNFQATVAQQQKEIQALTAQLKEQAAQIQKVSAQLAAASPSHGGLEAKNPAPQIVLNNQ